MYGKINASSLLTNHIIAHMASKTPRANGIPRALFPPGFDLRVAVNKVTKIYEAVGTSPAPANALLEPLGYSAMSGTAKSALGSLKKYGLIMAVDRNLLQLTDDAHVLVFGAEGEARYRQALERVALRPLLFRRLFKKYRWDWSDTDALQDTLLGFGFNRPWARHTIKVYGKSLTFLASVLGTDGDSPAVGPSPIGTKASGEAVEERGIAATPNEDQGWHVRVSSSGDINVAYTGRLQDPAFGDFVELLTVTHEAYRREPSDQTGC